MAGQASWAPMYVFLGLVPAAFATVALCSLRRDRRAAVAAADIEAVDARHERFWFPWRSALDDSDGAGRDAPHPPREPRSPCGDPRTGTRGDVVGGGVRPPPPLRPDREPTAVADADAAGAGNITAASERTSHGPWVQGMRQNSAEEGPFEDVSWD